jgi:hypothetical protein
VIISGYRFDKPDSMNDEKLTKQLQYHIAARQGPMTGLSSKWDYETGLFEFLVILFLSSLF